MQSLGLYTFKRSASTATADAVISIPLLLWALFVIMFQITQVGAYLHQMSSFLDLNTIVGSVTLLTEILSSFSALSVSILGQLALLISGPTLNQILSECEEETSLSMMREANDSVPFLSIERITTLLLYCLHARVIFVQFSLARQVPQQFVLETATYMVSTVIIMAGLTVMVMLFRELLTIASRKLNNGLPLDEDILGGAAKLKCRLHALEGTIRKVCTTRTAFI